MIDESLMLDMRQLVCTALCGLVVLFFWSAAVMRGAVLQSGTLWCGCGRFCFEVFAIFAFVFLQIS
jgi:hypothetical protein